MTDRQEWLSLLATSKPQTLAVLWADTGLAPDYVMLRKAETGSVMVRGRAGSVGKAFNLGEMTVTRASLRLADGTVGHGWCQGRDRKQAETAALLDALMQGPDATKLEARCSSHCATHERSDADLVLKGPPPRKSTSSPWRGGTDDDSNRA